MATGHTDTGGDEPRDFGIELGLAYTGFVDWLNRELRTAGFDDLGPAFGYVLRALAPGPLTLTQLAARLHMTTQGAAKIVAAMEAAGYLTRRPDPADARARLLELDERGRAAYRAARRLHARFERRLAERFGERRLATFRSVLAAVVAVGDGDPADRLLRPL